jgi:hypothetical protein
MAKIKQKQSPALLIFIIFLAVAIGLTVFMVNQKGSQDLRSEAAKAPQAQNFIRINEDLTQLKLGDPVTFTTGSYGLRGSEYPMVVLECYQGTDKVYAQLDHPDETFILGGGSSRWWLVGGPAMCKATLYSYGGKNKGYDVIRFLAETPEYITK